MRLLIPADGSSIHTERWCRYFHDQGFETALYSLEPIAINFAGKTYSGRRTTGKGFLDFYLAGKSYKRALEEFRPEIINPHFVASYGWLAARFKNCPIIATAWGSDLLILPRKSILYRRRVRKALKAADCCTFDNDNLREAATRYVPSEKLVKVVMGVDRGIFNACFKKEFKPAGPLKIIAPRGLQSVYDPATILKATALLRDKLDFKLVFVGVDDKTGTWKKKIAEAQLENRVSLLALRPHDKFVGGLKEYDIYLSAALSDSTSVALLEAMAAGLYPVVSDIEGNRAWIENEKNGLLFEAGSAEGLASALLAAATMRKNFKLIADYNRQLVANKAIWQNNLDKLRDLMLRMVGQ
jgi:glycosyltransferase involved in cell wall biosynthesis